MWKRTNHRTPALRPPILTHLAIFQPKNGKLDQFLVKFFFFCGICKKSVTILKHRAQHTGNEYHPPSNLHCNICTQVETLPPSCAYFCLSSCWLFSVLQLTPACTFHLRIFFSLLLPSAFATNPPSCKPLQTSYNGKNQHFCRPLLSTAYVSVESNQKVWKRTLLNPPICNRSVCLSVYLCIF